MATNWLETNQLRFAHLPNDVSICDEKFEIDEYNFEESYFTFEEQKCLQMFYETIHDILVNYNDIVLQIFEHLYYYPTSDDLGENKLVELRKHLFEFLCMHKNFFKCNAIAFELNDSNIIKKSSFILPRRCL